MEDHRERQVRIPAAVQTLFSVLNGSTISGSIEPGEGRGARRLLMTRAHLRIPAHRVPVRLIAIPEGISFTAQIFRGEIR